MKIQPKYFFEMESGRNTAVNLVFIDFMSSVDLQQAAATINAREDLFTTGEFKKAFPKIYQGLSEDIKSKATTFRLNPHFRSAYKSAWQSMPKAKAYFETDISGNAIKVPLDGFLNAGETLSKRNFRVADTILGAAENKIGKKMLVLKQTIEAQFGESIFESDVSTNSVLDRVSVCEGGSDFLKEQGIFDITTYDPRRQHYSGASLALSDGESLLLRSNDRAYWLGNDALVKDAKAVFNEVYGVDISSIINRKLHQPAILVREKCIVEKNDEHGNAYRQFKQLNASVRLDDDSEISVSIGDPRQDTIFVIQGFLEKLRGCLQGEDQEKIGHHLLTADQILKMDEPAQVNYLVRHNALMAYFIKATQGHEVNYNTARGSGFNPCSALKSEVGEEFGLSLHGEHLAEKTQEIDDILDAKLRMVNRDLRPILLRRSQGDVFDTLRDKFELKGELSKEHEIIVKRYCKVDYNKKTNCTVCKIDMDKAHSLYLSPPSFLQSLGSFISKHPIAAAAGFAALAAAVKYLPSVIQRALSSEVGGMTP